MMASHALPLQNDPKTVNSMSQEIRQTLCLGPACGPGQRRPETQTHFPISLKQTTTGQSGWSEEPTGKADPALLYVSDEPKGLKGNELEPWPSGQSGPGESIAVNNRYQPDTRLESTN